MIRVFCMLVTFACCRSTCQVLAWTKVDSRCSVSVFSVGAGYLEWWAVCYYHLYVNCLHLWLQYSWEVCTLIQPISWYIFGICYCHCNFLLHICNACV